MLIKSNILRHSKSILRQNRASFFSTSSTDASKNVVIVDGVRLPFAMSSTIYEDLMAVDLQRLAIKGLVDKVALPKDEVDYVIAGTVIQEVRTSNIAREAAVNAGLPINIGGHTVSMVRIGCYFKNEIHFELQLFKKVDFSPHNFLLSLRFCHDT